MLTEAYTGGPLDGVTVTNGFDTNLMRTVLYAKNSSAALLSDSFAYDAALRLQSVSDGVNAAAYSYLANSPLVQYITFKQSCYGFNSDRTFSQTALIAI